MTIHYVRTKSDDTLVDIESFPTDIKSAINIKVYTKLLLDLPKDKRMEFCDHIFEIQEMRDEYHDNGLETLISHASVLVEGRLKHFANKWGLGYATN